MHRGDVLPFWRFGICMHMQALRKRRHIVAAEGILTLNSSKSTNADESLIQMLEPRSPPTFPPPPSPPFRNLTNRVPTFVAPHQTPVTPNPKPHKSQLGVRGSKLQPNINFAPENPSPIGSLNTKPHSHASPPFAPQMTATHACLAAVTRCCPRIGDHERAHVRFFLE